MGGKVQINVLFDRMKKLISYFGLHNSLTLGKIRAQEYIYCDILLKFSDYANCDHITALCIWCF